MKRILLSFALTFGVFAQADEFSLGDFETSYLPGWTAVNPMGGGWLGSPYGIDFPDRPAGVVNVAEQYRNQTAKSGNSFLSVATLNAAMWFSPGGGGDAFDITVSRTVSLSSGNMLSGWASFYNGDVGPQDAAYVKILDRYGNEIALPWYESSGNPSNPGAHTTLPYNTTGEWTEWSWVAPIDGDYTIVLGASTFGDNQLDSAGMFDGISVKVPESGGTFGLLALSAAALFYVRRRIALA